MVWQRAVDLVAAVGRASRRLPGDERFGLAQQLRRSAVSVAANIAEGAGRYHTGDYLRFLGIARGSLWEVDTELEVARRLGYLTPHEAAESQAAVAETGRLLTLLSKSLRRHQPSTQGPNSLTP